MTNNYPKTIEEAHQIVDLYHSYERLSRNEDFKKLLGNFMHGSLNKMLYGNSEIGLSDETIRSIEGRQVFDEYLTSLLDAHSYSESLITQTNFTANEENYEQ